MRAGVRAGRRIGSAIAVLAAFAGTTRCAISVPAPKTAAGTPASANAAWASVLGRFVDDRGRIDFAGVARDPDDLDRYAAYVAAVDPESAPASFPTRSARLAYYLNAYNALAMYNVVRSRIPPGLGSIKVRFFYEDRLRMGGRSISLYRLENSVIRPLGEPRVHFALNCMVRGCPRLPRLAFDGERLDAQLDAAARLFLSEERNVRLDATAGIVHLSEILRWYAKDFLTKAPSLVAYANLYRAQPLPLDGKVEFIPYDWTLNAQ